MITNIGQLHVRMLFLPKSEKYVQRNFPRPLFIQNRRVTKQGSARNQSDCRDGQDRDAFEAVSDCSNRKISVVHIAMHVGSAGKSETSWIIA